MKITWKVLAAVAEQIKSELPGNHIQKINQISATDILLKFRKSTILISCNPAMPRIHLTTTAFENPDKAPNFCMLLRKHIGSAKLIDIVQPAGERILDFVLQSKNELGDIAPKHLIAEIMGRNSNVILADEHYKILGALRPGGDLTSPRPLITGIKYEFPPKNEKPFECDDVVSNDISAEIESACRGGHRPSSESAIDLFQFAEKKIKALNSKLSKLQTELATAQNRAQDKLFGELLTANIYRFPTTVGVDAHIDPPHGTMPTNMRRGDGPPSPAGDRDGRPYNAHAPHSSVGGTVSGAPHIEKGQPTTVGARLGAPDFVELENYYDNNNTIQIPIDSTLSIAKNAAAYYKTYEKKSRAEKHLTTQITKTIDEISYLESIQISLDLAQNKADYDAIRSELNLNSKTKNLCKSVRGASVSSVCKINPHMTIDSFDIYLGKNNTQNDHLSLKFAQNGDIWLHAQKLAGSHVLIRTHGREVPPNVLEAAARLAKEHSKAKNEAKATIDYCLAKFVKKPNAAKAGLVTYSNFSSIIV